MSSAPLARELMVERFPLDELARMPDRQRKGWYSWRELDAEGRMIVVTEFISFGRRHVIRTRPIAVVTADAA